MRSRRRQRSTRAGGHRAQRRDPLARAEYASGEGTHWRVRAASRLSRLMGSRSTPEHWDFTLLPFAGIIRGLLDAVGARSVVEVGADRGEFTAELLEWAGGTGARVTAVDPEPAPELVELTRGRRELTLLRRPSPEALGELEGADVVILDGDHNHYTVTQELRLVS